MKNTTIYIATLIALFLALGSTFGQDMSIVRSTNITFPEYLIDGTTSRAYPNSNNGTFEIVIELDNANYIENFSTIITGGYNYSCGVFWSADDVNYTFAGMPIIGEYTFNVDNYARYIKIEIQLTSGALFLQELNVSAQIRSIGYTYDQAGNRKSRSIIIQEDKSAFSVDQANPESQVNWDAMGIKLFPNPTHGKLILEFENYPDNHQVRYELYDFSGKLIFYKNMDNTSSMVDIDAYAEGNYMLRLFVGEEARTYQIVKN